METAATSSPPNGSPPVADSADAAGTSAAKDAASPLTTRRAAWLLGSRLSLAALANDRGVAAKNVVSWFQDAETAAKFLGTTVAPLPATAPTSETSPASRQVVDYLVTNGQRIGKDLSKQHSPEESALFEIALKSNILLLLYTPGASAGSSIAAAISQVGPQAKLPAELWQPLIEALNKQAPQKEIRAAVRKLHVEVDRYLGQEAGQSSR
jgi:hypothetical protein